MDQPKSSFFLRRPRSVEGRWIGQRRGGRLLHPRNQEARTAASAQLPSGTQEEELLMSMLPAEALHGQAGPLHTAAQL